MHVGISWVPWGCSVPWGIPSFEIWVPWGDIMSTVGVFSTVGYSNNKRFFPPRYSWYPPRASWYPPQYWTSPMVLKITPTVLMIPPRYWTPSTVLKISPHLSWYPHGTEHPHGTQDIPHGTQDIPHGTHDIPTVLNTPTVLSTPHGTAHTLYRVVSPNLQIAIYLKD